MDGTVSLIAYNGKGLCAVGDFGNENFNLPHKPDSSTNVQLTTIPLLHKTRVIGCGDYYQKLKYKVKK